MIINKLEILFKTIWIFLLLITIYTLGWWTFVYITFGNIGTEEFTIWNLIIPNTLTLGILIIYAKELLFGYKAKSKKGNLKSLLLFSSLILVLISIKFQQLDLFTSQLKSEYWQIILSQIIILTSYLGIILNRIFKFKELKSI